MNRPEGRDATPRWRWSPVLAAGPAAALLDILAAFAVYRFRGTSPLRVLQAISSGLLGASAFQGGAGTAALGLGLHFFIATVAAGVYALAALRLPVLVRRPFLSGGLYGVAVYFFMNVVVLPLSAVARRPFELELAAVILLVHVLFVGLPIALVIRRFTERHAEARAS